MKFKLVVSLLLASMTGSAVMAQGELKWTDNIYVNFGVGGMSVLNDKFNSPTLNAHIQLGKIITPTWGVRAEVGGLWQSLETQNTGYYKYCKKFGELNLDATLNLNSLFGNKNINRPVNVYAFVGPTMNISSAVNCEIDGQLIQTSKMREDGATVISQYVDGVPSFQTDGAKVRFGATAGLGLGIRLSNKVALNLEGRYGIAPSIFGYGSDCHRAEATLRGTVGVTYVFGGLKDKKPCCGMHENTSMAATTTPQVKVVEKVVPKEVVKEVVKEIPSAVSAAIFFQINRTEISDEGMVNVKLMADAMKKNPTVKYEVAGYADKGTGSESRNQVLSQKRADAVYDALVKEGVNPSQLIKVAKGGVDPMFYGKDVLSRVTILQAK